MIDSKEILIEMKEGILKNPVTKPYIDKMVANGIDKDIALDIMIYAWLRSMGRL